MRRTLLAAAACLLAAPLARPAAGADYTVSSYCRFVLQTVPTRDEVLVAIVAEAHALGPVPAVATTVRCTVTNERHQGFTAEASSVGPDAYVTGGQYMSWPGITVCSESAATWVDTAAAFHTATDGVQCGAAS